MPWSPSSVVHQRRNFARSATRGREPFCALCERYGISRRVGYKWLKRYQEKGEAGLKEQSRRPPVPRTSPAQRRWRKSALLQRKKTQWGPRKLLWALRRQHPRTVALPSERTLARLLHRHGLIGPRKRRTPRGPKITRSACTVPRSCNEVWTVDFKGHFRTADGARCEPLTIRDLHSRYLLMIEHVPHPNDATVRQAMTRCFQRFGLPQVIRVDNGTPFGGSGALGLTRLSVWWLRLGIQVEFTRRAKPQDNGAHEQMHRVLKAQTAHPPAATLAAQARRFAAFRRSYNETRPHEALGMHTPAEGYTSSPRRWFAPLALRYPRGWERWLVAPGGRIRWEGKTRLVGRAFAGEWIGLRPVDVRSSPREVYLGTLLVGHLYPADLAGMRPARWVRVAP